VEDTIQKMIPVLKLVLLGRPKKLNHLLGLLRVCLQILPQHRVGGTR
jgi:hypothetical protein